MSVPTWHVCRGSEPVSKAWPCSTRCCSRSASGSEPWPRGSGSCRSRGYADKDRDRRSWHGCDMTATTRHNNTYLPFCACTPLKRRARLCPKRWSRWRTLCWRPASSTFNRGDGRERLSQLYGDWFYLIWDGTCTPLCSSRHLLCRSSKSHIVFLGRDRDDCVKSDSTSAFHISG